MKPSQISQGERNIIGLCYFFANILQNQEEATAYNAEYLLVIYDPVSSFDIENKTGIMSFLRYQLGKFLLGNEHTKAVIMTHDLLTYYDSEKIFGELVNASNSKFGGEKQIFTLSTVVHRFFHRQKRNFSAVRTRVLPPREIILEQFSN